LAALALLALALPLVALGGGGSAPVDPEPRIAVGFDDFMHFGVTVIRNRQGKPLKEQKRITYSDRGSTNSTMLRLAGKDVEFGGPDGKWVEKSTDIPAAGGSGKGVKSVWAHGPFEITQIVRVAASSQAVDVGGTPKRLLNTVRIRYVIENKSKKAHKVGMRFMLDTLIGSNDGVPFTVPGSANLISTHADYTDPASVPDFVQALETGNLEKPGTVAHLSTKLGGNLEAPSRLSLTNWMGGPPYEVPVRDLSGDSAIVMYWAIKELKPGEKRNLGFAYGLGDVAAAKGGNMGVTVSGSFEENTEFTVTAYLSNPTKGQTVELKLPSGLDLARGTAKMTVPTPPAGKSLSIVTWHVRAATRGGYTLEITSSSGPTTIRRIVTITERQKGG
jgi:hypothetical protein